MLKKYVGAAVFIAWGFFVAVLVAGLVFFQDNRPQGALTATGDAGVTLSPEEVARHNNAGDCWVIINNNVFDLTTYLDQHPGEASTILPYCGADGTDGFDTKDQPNPAPHSNLADELLTKYLLGAVGERVAGTTLTSGAAGQPTRASATSAPTRTSAGGETAITLTSAEIARHATADDCWVIINDNVYDLTAYLNLHPGDADTILPYCGADGTSGFDTKDKSTPAPHSAAAAGQLVPYLLGAIGESISATSPDASATSAPTGTSSGGPPVTLTSAEIASHNTGTDCWVIINDSVYNLTTYLNQHPGNAGTILPYCGADGTNGFATMDRPNGRTHSAFASTLLAQFRLGSVGDTVAAGDVNPSVTIPPGGGDDDDEYEDEDDD